MCLGARIGNAVANNEEQVSKSQNRENLRRPVPPPDLWICPTSLSFTAELDGTCKLEQNLLQQKHYITFSGIFRSATLSDTYSVSVILYYILFFLFLFWNLVFLFIFHVIFWYFCVIFCVIFWCFYLYSIMLYSIFLFIFY